MGQRCSNTEGRGPEHANNADEEGGGTCSQAKKNCCSCKGSVQEDEVLPPVRPTSAILPPEKLNLQPKIWNICNLNSEEGRPVLLVLNIRRQTWKKFPGTVCIDGLLEKLTIQTKKREAAGIHIEVDKIEVVASILTFMS